MKGDDRYQCTISVGTRMTGCVLLCLDDDEFYWETEVFLEKASIGLMVGSRNLKNARLG